MALRGLSGVSGKEGRAFATIDGENVDLFFAKSVNASVSKHKSTVKAIGKRLDGHKTSGGEGTGSMTIYYMTPYFRTMLREYLDTGIDFYFNMTISNTDPETSAGSQTALLIDCNLDSVMIAQLDADTDDPLEEDMDFTFEDFRILEEFTPFTE